MRSAWVGVIVGALAAGCGGDGETPEEVSPVGTWRDVIHPRILIQPEGNWAIRTFGADGSYSEDTDGPAGAGAAFTGTYQIGSGRIAYPAANGTVINSDLALTEDGHLMLWVMRPLADVEGVVGNWAGTVSFRRGEERWSNDLRLDLNEDGSASFRTLLELSPGEPPQYVELGGIWELDSNIVWFSSQYTFNFMVSPDALGQTAMMPISGP